MRKLTETQKENIIFASGVAGTLLNLENFKDWHNNKINEQALKVAEEALKLVDLMGLYEDEAKQFRKDVDRGKYRLECISNLEWKEQKRKYADTQVQIKRWVRDTLAEYAKDYCKYEGGRNPSACVLRKAFIESGIDEYSPEVDKEDRFSMEYCKDCKNKCQKGA